VVDISTEVLICFGELKKRIVGVINNFILKEENKKEFVKTLKSIINRLDRPTKETKRIFQWLGLSDLLKEIQIV
jgi:phosphomevalonate kinase